jgi:flavin-dependent dehydrogenase
VQDHVLLAGDAAGLITPLCGNGMSMAMHASKLCFQSIQTYLDDKISRGEMEKHYEARWKKTFSRRLATGRTVQHFFGNPALTSLFLQTMNALPAIARSLIRSTHGQPF